LKEKKSNNIELIQYWIESSDRDYKTMNNLYKSKDYAWSLFVGHLVIEKLLKASFIKAKREHPPLIHNLLKISDLAGIKYSKEEEKLIDVITSFNLGAR
jgi:HEPN domain-containing protein